MSYIRSTSNPERLYVWSDGYKTYWWIGSDLSKWVPSRGFEKFLERCDKACGGYGDYSYRNFCIIESEKDFKVEFYYKKKLIARMYLTTWKYILNNRVK